MEPPLWDLPTLGARAEQSPSPRAGWAASLLLLGTLRAHGHKSMRPRQQPKVLRTRVWFRPVPSVHAVWPQGSHHPSLSLSFLIRK